MSSLRVCAQGENSNANYRLTAPYFARIRAFTAKDEEIGCLEIMAQLSDAN